jgi:cytochrome b pre-mRNA-processing protein 3
VTLSFLSRILGGGRSDRARMLPLYERVVAIGRDPAWYRQGQVPDTIDGRFDIIAAVMALVLLRLEREPDRETRVGSTLLTEMFIDDMEGSLRQIGIGDLVVGKHMGKLMGALGGRIGAFREAADEPAMRAAVARNVFHEAPPSPEAAEFVTERLLRFRAGLEAMPSGMLLEGEVPAL